VPAGEAVSAHREPRRVSDIIRLYPAAFLADPLPSMALFTLGINHHTAPLSVREQVTFHAEHVRQALTDLTRW
jgi:hypothetical protein